MDFCGDFFEEIESDIDMIEERLYLGNFDSIFKEQKLKSLGITHILGVMESFTFYKEFEGIMYMQIKIHDSPKANILKHIPSALAFISQGMRSGKVLVHCQMGISRSASIVASYIMVSRSLEFRPAIEFIRHRRPCVYPNEGFQKQLSSIDVNDYKQYLL